MQAFIAQHAPMLDDARFCKNETTQAIVSYNIKKENALLDFLVLLVSRKEQTTLDSFFSEVLEHVILVEDFKTALKLDISRHMVEKQRFDAVEFCHKKAVESFNKNNGPTNQDAQ